MLSRRELQRAARLLDARLAGARLERVVVPDATRVVLSLHRSGAGALHLLASADPETGRLSVVAKRPAAPRTPPPFAELLRARLGGARLVEATAAEDDRRATLRFDGSAGPASLVLELFGARADVYLLDAEGRVGGALRNPAGGRRERPADAARRPSAVRATTSSDTDRFAETPDAGFFEAVETFYAARESERERTRRAKGLERAIRRAESALARKEEALRADAEAANEAERLRREGELLKSILPTLRTGDRVARARDFATGAEVTLALDSTRSPAANLEDRFRSARKAERRARRAAQEGEALAERRRELDALAAELAAAARGTIAELDAFAERPAVRRLVDRFTPSARPEAAATPRPTSFRVAGRKVPGRLLPRRYRGASGLEIWVGRSDAGNDLLTTRLARGNDLFFHLDAAPGSHVILRTEGRLDPPSEAVLEACELAVHFSKLRDATRVDVLVVPVKQVRKPKGAKPGLVVVSGGRTIRLRRDRKRLERVLAARVED